MIVHYQPVIEIGSSRVVRAEVFCRFPDSAGEMQHLETFIPHAERVGLISELTQSVLLLALTQRHSWNRTLPLSFNVSRLDLENSAFFDHVVELFERSQTDPRLITFELNDGIQSIEDGAAFETMRRLRAVGIRFCVDGFGPTISMFSYLELERVAVREVKIDALGRLDVAKRTTIGSVVELANRLHIDVIAKNVETEDQLALVERLGCRFAQGFAIAKPMEQSALIAWLADRETAPPVLAPLPVAPPTPAVPAKRSFLDSIISKRLK